MEARKGRLGIMVTERMKSPPFADSNYYRKLCLLGARRGLLVYVFSPERIYWGSRTVIGYTYRSDISRWTKALHPLPDLIYDRCFFSSKSGYLRYRTQVRRLLKFSRAKFLGHGLRGKWQVQDILCQDTAIRDYLPMTERYAGIPSLTRWLNQEGRIFLKPQGGSQGRGALMIRAIDDDRIAFIVIGRDEHNEMFRFGFYHYRGLAAWLSRWIGQRNYVIQSYLELTTEQGEPFDVRAFMMKNNTGRWQLIGTGVRKGSPGALTSNLHGGGVAEDTLAFLQAQYPDCADQLYDTISKLSLRIASVLEKNHGRLVELGIDFGIDKSGRLWVLEVNSKPGRSIFRRLGDKNAQKSSIIGPIQYARYLWDRQLGG